MTSPPSAKYPQFAGNVSVVDTDKPYGPKKRQFWFDTKDSPSGQGYHWNNNARSYMNIGMSMADETFVPYTPKHDLKQPEKYGREHSRINPFNIDQTKLSLLVIQQEGNLDEIRVGPTYESVVGGGTRESK